MRIGIYQMDADKDTRRVKFENYEQTERHGGVRASEYKCVFHGDVKARDLDDIYHIFNGYREPYIGTFQGHSLSVSDIVEVLGDIPEMYGRVDYLGSNGEVGEEYRIATKEVYDREVYDSIDCGRPFTPHILEGQHITLVEPGCHFCDSFGWVKCGNFDTSACEDMDGLRALMILPGKTPVETRIIDDLSHWQRAVSRCGEDALMQVVAPFDDSAVIVCNEESKMNGMEGNRRLNGDVIAGPMYIVGEDTDGEFCGLTEEQVQKYKEMFAETEDISPEEVEASIRFSFSPW